MRPPGCPDPCPGCSHRDLSPSESEARKQAWLARELASWASVLQPIRSPSVRWGYRQKSVVHARLLDGVWHTGLLRKEGREEILVPIPQCPVHDPALNERLARVRGLASAALPLVYVVVSGGAVTVVLKAVREARWLDALRAWEWPEGDSLFVCWHPGAGRRVIDSKRVELVKGPPWREAGGLWHGPAAFRQQVPELEDACLGLAEAHLLGTGLEPAVEFSSVAACGDSGASGIAAVVDFYCGLGRSLKRWRERSLPCLGVELSGESLTLAGKNAPGADLLRGKVEDRLPQVEVWLEKQVSWALYTNPPRLGHDLRVAQWVRAKGPTRIAYVSCNPRSLRKDLEAWGDAYLVTSLQPFDYFPQTGHVETLALLERRAKG